VKLNNDRLSISGYLLRDMEGETLLRYLFAEEGGYTDEIIRSLVLPADGQSVVATLTSGDCDAEFAAMRQRLTDYGVGFVHQFDVEPAFQVPGTTSFFALTPNPLGPGLVELHSMLLVGVRYDTLRKEYVMLLQNWWEAKEFVEVGQAYWKACHACLLFVKTPQKTLRAECGLFNLCATAGVEGVAVMPPQYTRM